MYYIRKLSCNANLSKLKSVENTASIDADILKQELGTSNNTLSFWKCECCESSDDMKNAIKAILLSTTAIKNSQFIVIEDSIAKKYGLVIDDTEPGKTGYKGYESLHVNITNLTYSKIGNVIDMLREIVTNQMFTPSLNRASVKSYIEEVNKAGLLNREDTDKDLINDIDKFLSR